MSDSTSTNQQQTSYADNRSVLGERSLYANNGASVSTSSTSFVLDNGAINRAFNTTDRSVAKSLNFASDFGSDALNTANKSLAGALNFASNQGDSAFNTANKSLAGALNFASDATDSALTTVDKSQAAAFNFGGKSLDLTQHAFDRALDYGTAATSAALQNLQATEQLTANAYADAKGRGALTDKILIGAIVAMAIVAAMAVRKG